MQMKPKKIAVAFRLDSSLTGELKRRSDTTGISQARIVEDALTNYFAGAMTERLRRAINLNFAVPDARHVRIHFLQALAA